MDQLLRAHSKRFTLHNHIQHFFLQNIENEFKTNVKQIRFKFAVATCTLQIFRTFFTGNYRLVVQWLKFDYHLLGAYLIGQLFKVRLRLLSTQQC